LQKKQSASILGYFFALSYYHTSFTALNPASYWGIAFRPPAARTPTTRLSLQRGWLENRCALDSFSAEVVNLSYGQINKNA